MKYIVFVVASLLLVIGCTSTKDREDERDDVRTQSPGADASLPTGEKRPARLFAEQSPPPGAEREFKTDFSKSLVDFSEIISGGPPKDGIPAINNPRFISARDAGEWIESAEMVFVIDGSWYGSDEIRIYPVQIFIYHEIVNDTIGETPITVTYCPLCNSAVAFEGRSSDGGILRFGVSGRLRFSNMIMYDDKSESWWQQATGKAIVGDLVGERLNIIPLLTLSWKEAYELYPDARVLSRDTGHQRPYGKNPYTGYDTLDHPFLFRGGKVDASRDPFDRVVVGQAGGEEKAFLYATLQRNVITHDRIGNEEVVIFWAPGSASPLDASSVASGRIVGSANIFSNVVDDTPLTFGVVGDTITDNQTDSVWSTLGVALSGKLQGRKLRPLPTVQHFWFSYSAFSEES